MPKIDRRIAVIENTTEATVNPGDDANQAIRVNVVAGAAGGVSHTDDAAFTPGSGSVVPIGALLDDTATDTVNEGDVGVVRMSADRVLLTKISDGTLSASIRDTGSNDSLNVAITDGSGNQITSFGGGTQYTEGDTDATITGTVAMWEDAADTLVATSAAKPLPVEIIAGTGSGGTAAADESAFTEGTTNFTPVGGVFNDALASDPAAGEAAAVRITSDRAMHVNLRGASGTELGTNSAPVQIGDAGGNISIDDGGNTITVDGTVAVSSITTAVVPGTGATNLGKAEDAVHSSGDTGVMALGVRNDAGTALAADGDYIPFSMDSGGAVRVTGGGGGVQYTEGDTDSTITGTAMLWEDAADTLVAVSAAKPLPVGDAGGSLTVDGTVAVSSITTSVVPGTGATNLGKAEDAGHSSGDVGVMALAVRNDTPGALATTDLDYSPLQVNATGQLRVEAAAVAHDGVDSGNPVKVGAVAIAHGTNPTAVAAADRTNLYANRAGVLFMIGGHPNAITRRDNYTSAQTDTALVTVGAGTKIVVTRMTFACDKANSVNVTASAGFGTANTPTGAGAVLSHPGIDPGGGITAGNGGGILGVGADNEDLRFTCTAPTSGSITVVTTYFTIES